MPGIINSTPKYTVSNTSGDNTTIGVGWDSGDTTGSTMTIKTYTTSDGTTADSSVLQALYQVAVEKSRWTAETYNTIPAARWVDSSINRLEIIAQNRVVQAWLRHVRYKDTVRGEIVKEQEWAIYEGSFDTATSGGLIRVFPPPTPLEERRYAARKRLTPVRLNHRGLLARSESSGNRFNGVPQEEILALQLLRKMVAPEEFRRYLKHGFINVKGASGLIYQIGRNQKVSVWSHGKKVASLCVHLRDWYSKPPTDEVVAILLIAECDEADLWKRSNISWYNNESRQNPAVASLRLAG